MDGGKAPAGYMAGQAGRRTRTGWLCGACMVGIGFLMFRRGNSKSGCLVWMACAAAEPNGCLDWLGWPLPVDA